MGEHHKVKHKNGGMQLATTGREPAVNGGCCLMFVHTPICISCAFFRLGSGVDFGVGRSGFGGSVLNPKP